MDWFLIYITIGSLVALDLLGHWLIEAWKIHQLKNESRRFEADWYAYLDELKIAVKEKK
jgi:uncharacterized protein YqjF (DUF2071 family)